MKVQILGDAPNSLEGRNPFGFLVEAGDKTVLLDCGPNTLSALASRNIKPTDIDQVFISHEHIDHWGGLLEFLNAYSFESYYDPSLKPHNLELLISKKNEVVLHCVNHSFGWLQNKDLGQRISILHSEENKGCIEIPHSVANVALKIERNGKAMCYLPDFSSITDEMTSFCSNVDLVIASVAGPNEKKGEMSEFGFCVSGEAIDLCNKANVRNFLPFHVFFESDIELVYSELKQSTRNTKILASDVKEYVI